MDQTHIDRVLRVTYILLFLAVCALAYGVYSHSYGAVQGGVLLAVGALAALFGGLTRHAMQTDRVISKAD